MCEVLLDAGTKLDETDNDGKTPLMLSAQVLQIIFFVFAIFTLLF